jgi:hypothetical protein
MTQAQNKIEMYKNRVDLYNKWNFKSFAFTYFSRAQVLKDLGILD